VLYFDALTVLALRHKGHLGTGTEILLLLTIPKSEFLGDTCLSLE